MKISRSTWHYNLIEDGLFWIGGWVPSKSLCIYFWQVVGMLLTGVVEIMAAVSPIVAIIGFGFDYLPEEMLWRVPYVLWACFGAICIGVAALFVFACTVALICEGVKLAVKKIWIKKPSSSSTDLVYSYIKAKKDKVCPILEFEG